ncbi:MAG: phosphoribosyltransferase [Pleurocapsa sp. SU_5_0]|nr:phosphoribosyltransferase [Pleurocapsa sp. SU_5_0]NJO98433.1 phosphoribosyltransferase [Pleurocapsa sp. CRU_1_2]NJR47885.1 phosphoribosyltransferase [Hyellaceae cyanobacterium CSU_1_1]
MNAVFLNRQDAGKRLAEQLNSYLNHPQAIVLGLPRGGVPVAYEVANSLNLPLDVCLVKKIGLPNYPETAMGAVAEDALIHNYSGNITILDEYTIKANNIDQGQIQAIAAQVKAELRWRNSCYRHCRPMLTIKGRQVIIVDDGIATGLTMHAAVTALQKHQPQKIIIATPVASHQAIKQLETLVDDISYLVKPKSLGAVGFWYEDFSQVSDQDICNLLCQETHRNLAEVSRNF